MANEMQLGTTVVTRILVLGTRNFNGLKSIFYRIRFSC